MEETFAFRSRARMITCTGYYLCTIGIEKERKQLRINWQIQKYSQSLDIHLQSGWTSYRKISWSLNAARFGFRSLWNLKGTLVVVLPRCLSNFRAIWFLQHSISRLRYFTRDFALRRPPAQWIEVWAVYIVLYLLKTDVLKVHLRPEICI